MSDPVYSDAERRMFIELGFDYLLGVMHARDLYNYACQESFLNGACGPYADALRSAAKARRDVCSYSRLTPEFDRLITQHIGDGVSSIGKVPPPRGPKIITDRPYLPG